LRRKFARNELLPIANEIDRSESTPDWVAKRCAELGFYGLYIAEEYGGMDAGLVTACVVLEEIAKASPAFAGLLSGADDPLPGNRLHPRHARTEAAPVAALCAR
jgi:alkylation response protein AidB-like acyl-CoA dehydrogenase